MEFETVQVLLFIVVTFLITEGLKGLSGLVKYDLTGYKAAIVASVVALLVGLFESVIVPLIPEIALPVVEPAAQLILVILSAAGVHKTMKRFEPEHDVERLEELLTEYEAELNDKIDRE
jgi:hypothetical protein